MTPMSDIPFLKDGQPSSTEKPGLAGIRRQRGQSTWPFGPVGVRQERRRPFRANDLEMSNTPRRRATDHKTDC